MHTLKGGGSRVQVRKGGEGVQLEKLVLGNSLKCGRQTCYVGTAAMMFCLASVVMLVLLLNCPVLGVTKSLQTYVLEGNLSQNLMKSPAQGSYSISEDARETSPPPDIALLDLD